MKNFGLLAVLFASACAFEQPTINDFKNEETVRAFPQVDLAPFGFHGGQLPRVYDFTDTGAVYNSTKSFQYYNEIVAGRHNASEEVSQQRRRALTSAMEKRDNYMEFVTWAAWGNTETKDEWALNGDGICRTGQHAPYRAVAVTHVSEAYITFWGSDVCNGKKQSMNPHCGTDDYQPCAFSGGFQPWSFRLYSGCHSSDKDDCQN
ncbi:hypothetical protein F5Y04DRAFT_293014 [Hypomontagnella monticulosa]|nr:hypothetical protein F5Y04DRAFT_293014 [Hypomontagnella monticulosa]